MDSVDTPTELDCVESNTDCVGCSACLAACPQNCIAMVEDAEGFEYPLVDLKRCVSCGICRAVCPSLCHVKAVNGPTAFGCRSKDDALRLVSSSGGVFTELARLTLEDGGMVFGAGFDDCFDVRHVCVESEAELGSLRGSKYVQSSIGRTYVQVEQCLKLGTSILFSGTPCQIAGLKLYLREPMPRLLCVDFFCHGVPSPSVWRRYIDFQERRNGSRLSGVSFRAKDRGWRRFSMALLFVDGSRYCRTLDYDPYMRAFLADICLRPSCHACRFKGLNRQSDVTLADFWGIEKVIPRLDDNLGTSLVLANTPNGRLALERLAEVIEIEEVSLQVAGQFNAASTQSASPHAMRQAFFANLNAVRFDILVRRYCAKHLLPRLERRWSRMLDAVFARVNPRRRAGR